VPRLWWQPIHDLLQARGIEQVRADLGGRRLLRQVDPGGDRRAVLGRDAVEQLAELHAARRSG